MKVKYSVIFPLNEDLNVLGKELSGLGSELPKINKSISIYRNREIEI